MNTVVGIGYTPEQCESLQYRYKKRILYRIIKRSFDVLVSVILLLILSPLMLTVAFLIIIDDGFPVIFRQERAGQYMRPFTIYKFRTMQKNTSNQDGITRKNDIRITVLGRKIRRFRLDEVPQVINVLKGDMSFVGPRPDMIYSYDKNNYLHKCVLMVKPGITSPASIEFRNEEQLLATSDNPKKTYQEVVFPQKTIMNVAYVSNMSFLFDCKIMLTTVAAMLKRSN